MRDADDTDGPLVERMLPRSLLVPPGIPDFLSRERHVTAGRVVLQGRAWSGQAPVERVEVSADGGATWADAELEPPLGPYALARLQLRVGRGRRESTSSAAARPTPRATSSRSSPSGTTAASATTRCSGFASLRRPGRLDLWRRPSRTRSSARRSRPTRSATSSLVVGAGRARPDRRSPAPRAAGSGTTTASATSTSRPSSSTSRSATSIRSSSRRSRSRRTSSARSGRRWRPSRKSTLARLVAEVTPGDISMTFFTNGGAEANENAIKLARWYTGRHKIIARYRSYHGATAGAMTLTGDPRRWPAEPGIPGVVRMLDPYTYRCPAGHPDPCPVCTGAPHLEEILQYEGAAHRRGRDPRDRDRDERDHRPARRLPPVDPRGLRPARDPAHRRRGHGRLRPHRQVVRRRQLGRRPRHPHDGEGDQLRLRPARRDVGARADRRRGCATSTSPAD